MTDIVLPKLNQAGSNEWADPEDNDVAIREVVNGELDNSNLSGAAGITRANLATEAKPFKWYTPVIIATEQSRTSTEYGTLTTPDEVKEVVVPENAIVQVRYRAAIKSSVSGAGLADIFIGSNQLKGTESGAAPAAQGATTDGTTFRPLRTSSSGLTVAGEGGGAWTGDVSTGQALGGLCEVFGLSSGTYAISIRFRATSGSVTAKERRLWVGVLGATV